MNILFISSRKRTKSQFRREGESVFFFHQSFTDEAVEHGRNASGIFPAPTEMGQTGRTVEQGYLGNQVSSRIGGEVSCKPSQSERVMIS